MPDAKCYAGEAIHRARSMVNNGGQYVFGTGDYRPVLKNGKVVEDLPWTSRKGETGSDCAGFAICYAWKLKRHRPGFNVGSWATISDDINCNSALEDGLHKRELFDTLDPGDCVFPGDLLVYPTIYLKGHPKPWIGHVGLIEFVPLKFKYGDWRRLGIIQCHGPNGYTPGVVRSDGSVWSHHDTQWGKLEHTTRVVRPKERG